MKKYPYILRALRRWFPEVLPPVQVNADTTLASPSETDTDNGHWAEDDDKVRDEGTLFGLSYADTEERIQAIVQHYEGKCAILRVQQQHAHQQAELARENLAQHDLQADSLRLLSPPRSFEWIRWGLGVLGYGAIIMYNFTLVMKWVGSHWDEPFLIALGVYLFGLFAHFNRLAYLYHTDTHVFAADGQPERWKVLLEEFGIPLGAAALIVAWGWPHHSIGLSLATGVFCLLVFVFVGKGFFGSIGRLHIALREGKQRRDHARTIRRHEKTRLTLVTALDQAQAKQDQVPPLSPLEAERDARIALFRSEFHLARQTRDRLTDRQRQSFSA